MKEFYMKSFLELIETANSEIKTITSSELSKILIDTNLVILDVQSKETVEKNGMIKGAVHANRGFLEFYADQREDNPFRKKELDPLKKIVVYCGAGGQGALATKTLQDMGFEDVSNLEGGVNSWLSNGNSLEKIK